eukprot:gene2028-1218_t
MLISINFYFFSSSFFFRVLSGRLNSGVLQDYRRIHSVVVWRFRLGAGQGLRLRRLEMEAALQKAVSRLGRGRLFAIDVEFVKTRGAQYARSVAVVPLKPAPVNTDAASSSSSLPRLTAFDFADAALLSLQSSVVLELAEALPAGHVLLPLLQGATVKGDELERIRSHHVALAKKGMDAWRENGTTVACDGSANQKKVDQPLCAPAPTDEKLKRSEYRRHQIKASIPENFETFDPYSIPNCTAFGESSLKAIFDDAVESSTFTEAVGKLSTLRAYGKGRGRYKALSLVLEMMPAFGRDILHASFASSAVWCDFLGACRQAAAAEVERVNFTYRRDGPAHGAGSATPLSIPDISYVECTSLASLSESLSRLWARCLFAGDGAQQRGREGKFYSYGSVDSGVLKRTLALSCGQGASAAHGKRSSSCPSHRLCPLHPFPRDVLLTPHQLRVIDITSHTLYETSGFLPSTRRKISLSDALQLAAKRDAVAAELLQHARPHDPVWDAQALGCVCVACGISPCPLRSWPFTSLLFPHLFPHFILCCLFVCLCITDMSRDHRWRRRMLWLRRTSLTRRRPLFPALHQPHIKGLWGDLSARSAHEKNEILHGSWRQTPSVKLVPDPDDRDRGGCSSGAELGSLEFQTDEEVEAFLVGEAEQSLQEQQIPTLRLASEFFKDLAKTANEEVERSEAGLDGAAPLMTCAQRRAEERDFHFNFFVSYYQEQGVLSAPETERWRRIFRSPLSFARLRVNAMCPLVRLVVRHQMEKANAYFRSTADPLLFEVRTADDPTAVLPFPQPRCHGTTLPPCDGAALLQDWLAADGEERLESVPALEDPSAAHETAVQSLAAPPPALVDTAPRNVCTVGHLHWLQRQVASGSATLMDTLSQLVAVASLALLLKASESNSFACSFILDIGECLDTSDSSDLVSVSREGNCNYSLDISEYLTEETALLERQALAPGWRAAQRLEHLQKAVVVALQPRTRTAALPSQQSPNLLVLSPTRRHPHLSSSSRSTQAAPSGMADLVPPELASCCAVVLCAPRTSADGCRPRSFEERMDSQASERIPQAVSEDSLQVVPLPAENFISTCQVASRLFPSLQEQLRSALRCASDGGYVLYVTRSMNPIENEAVVCSVLSECRQHNGTADGPLDGIRSVRCVDLSQDSFLSALGGTASADIVVWRTLWDDRTLSGLSSWKGVEGGPPQQESSRLLQDVVDEVAACSRRVDPLRAADDVWFAVALTVSRSPVSLLAPTSHGTDDLTSWPVILSDSRAELLMCAPKPRGSKKLSLASRDCTVSCCSAPLAEWVRRNQRKMLAAGWAICGAGIGIGSLSVEQLGGSAPCTDGPWSRFPSAAIAYLRCWSSISGTSHTDGVGRLLLRTSRMAESARGPSLHPYCVELAIPLWLIPEFLRVRSLSTLALHKYLQRLSVSSVGASCAEKLISADLRGFLNDVQQLGKREANRGGAHSVIVVLRPQLSALRSSTIPDAQGSSRCLSPDVVEELEEVALIGRLIRAGDSDARLQLDAGDGLEDTVLDRDVREMCLRLRDAVVYLCTRGGLDVYGDAINTFQLHRPSLRERRLSSARTDTRSGVTLKDDEYLVETPEPVSAPSERAARSPDLRPFQRPSESEPMERGLAARVGRNESITRTNSWRQDLSWVILRRLEQIEIYCNLHPTLVVKAWTQIYSSILHIYLFLVFQMASLLGGGAAFALGNETNSSTLAPSNTTRPPEEEMHQLMESWEFVCLTLVVALCYYAAMCMCTIAVGESYSRLVSPFSLLKTILVDLYETIRHGSSRAGLSYEEVCLMLTTPGAEHVALLRIKMLTSSVLFLLAHKIFSFSHVSLLFLHYSTDFGRSDLYWDHSAFRAGWLWLMNDLRCSPVQEGGLPIVRLEASTPFNAAAAGNGDESAVGVSLYTFLRSAPSRDEISAHFGTFLNHLRCPMTAQSREAPDAGPSASLRGSSRAAMEMQVNAVAASVFHNYHGVQSSATVLPDWKTLLTGRAEATLGKGEREHPASKSLFQHDHVGVSDFRVYPSVYDVGSWADGQRDTLDITTPQEGGAVDDLSAANVEVSAIEEDEEEIQKMNPSPLADDGVLQVSSLESEEDVGDAQTKWQRSSEGGRVLGGAQPQNSSPVVFYPRRPHEVPVSSALPPDADSLGPSLLRGALEEPHITSSVHIRGGDSPGVAYQLPRYPPGSVHPLFHALRSQVGDATPSSTPQETLATMQQHHWATTQRAVEHKLAEVKVKVKTFQERIDHEMESSDALGGSISSPAYRGLKNAKEYVKQLEQRVFSAETLFTVERHEEETLRIAHAALLLEVKTMNLLLRDVSQLAVASAAMVQEARDATGGASTAEDVALEDELLAQDLLACLSRIAARDGPRSCRSTLPDVVETYLLVVCMSPDVVCSAPAPVGVSSLRGVHVHGSDSNQFRILVSCNRASLLAWQFQNGILRPRAPQLLPSPARDVAWCPLEPEPAKGASLFLVACCSQPLQLRQFHDEDSSSELQHVRAVFPAQNSCGIQSDPSAVAWVGRGGTLSAAAGYGGPEERVAVRLYDVEMAGSPALWSYAPRRTGRVAALCYGGGSAETTSLLFTAYYNQAHIDVIDVEHHCLAAQLDLKELTSGRHSGSECVSLCVDPAAPHLIYAGGRNRADRILCWDIRHPLQPLHAYSRPVGCTSHCGMRIAQHSHSSEPVSVLCAGSPSGLQVFSTVGSSSHTTNTNEPPAESVLMGTWLANQGGVWGVDLVGHPSSDCIAITAGGSRYETGLYRARKLPTQNGKRDRSEIFGGACMTVNDLGRPPVTFSDTEDDAADPSANGNKKRSQGQLGIITN